MIYLMRHGEDDNTRLGGWSNAWLSNAGIEHVKNSAEKLIAGNYNISQIFSSDLPRAKETAEIIADGLNIEVRFVCEFREINNGSLAGMLKEQAKIKYPGIFTAHWNGSKHIQTEKVQNYFMKELFPHGKYLKTMQQNQTVTPCL